MKTKATKKLTALLVVGLFAMGGASLSYALDSDRDISKSGKPSCPLGDKMILAQLNLNQEQVSTVSALCAQHLHPAKTETTASGWKSRPRGPLDRDFVPEEYNRSDWQ